MPVVVLASVRSCGTTTLAVALAATWPAGRKVILVELDPAGGTLAASSGWAAEPSLVSLAAAARRTSDPEALWAHCQHLPGGAAVLAAPGAAGQARGATRMLSGLLGRLGELDADVLVDTGRLDPTAPLPGVAAGAARLVFCARPRLSDLNALAAFLDTGLAAGLLDAGRLALVLVGDGPYPDAEIAEALGVEVAGRLPWDEGAAERLATIPASDRRLRLSPLVRAARSLATALAADVHAPEAVPASGHDEAVPPRRRQGRRLLSRFGPPSIAAGAGAGEVRRDAGFGAGGADGDVTLGDSTVVNGTGVTGRVMNGSAPGAEAAR
ncbi:MAG: hypothetical protein ACYCU7_09115 [Acidimicrobiales bacterium]